MVAAPPVQEEGLALALPVALPVAAARVAAPLVAAQSCRFCTQTSLIA